MLPYILAAVGGYLIGDSLKGKQYAEGGMMARGGKAESESIREHYINSYPTDELGSEINPKATFDGLYKVLEKGKDAYAYIGVGDSIVRERVFEKLADLKGVDYEVIYTMWLSKYSEGGKIEVGDKVKYKNAKYHATVIEVIDDVEIPYAKIEYSDGKMKKAYLEDLQKVILGIAPEYVNPEYK